MFHKMKPETLRRKRLERIKQRMQRDAERNRRISELARLGGPDSIWAEMLTENGQ